ncbi:microtubule-associated protein futsch-like isoform X50 [Aphis gossypii]|uniref:microtubule-associated protein futsch-like isoform X50 n=1 Tax=Aphis gossypii TaxID=80765 RepID=UPI002158E972|nr:microtubule-associated protein futsch-like isoform X50 [Aphis gossypii]
MGNPSDHVETPLTGGYLLIVLAEPRTAEHKLAILKKLTKGLSCWNYEESGVEIVTELNAIVNQNIEGEEGKNGEQLFQYVSDNLVAEILINPQHSTLVQCVRNLLASFTKYRCIIHAGYSFTENGSWIVQDGSFSVIDFLDAYKTAEAQRTIRLHENHIRIDLHCSADADWNQVSRLKGTRFLLNPPEKIVDNESIESTVRWLCDKIEVVELDILLEGSQVVGNIRFSRPTLYVFPAGQGDSALFGINGFNMLIDGGAGRNSCFWGFARHLDRLDAVLLTRLNSSNLEGVASFLKRKTMSSLYPQIGHFFCNFKTRKQISSPNTDAKQDVLSISLIDTAQSIITDLKQLQLRPHLCYRNINLEPINLYHKVGHGKLDMYVLNPSKDSKEVKDFLTKWNEGDQKLFNPTKDLQFPLPNIISVCTLLVWQPANPNTTITRIFFPGSSPQNKIFESLERVRHLEFLKHPSCSIKSMSSSTSVTIKSQTTKKTVLEKMIPGETKAVKTMENLEVSTSASNAVIQTAIIPTVPKEGTPKPKFPVEAEKSKPNLKTVTKETVNSKTKIEHKYSSISAKVNSNKVIQKSTTIKKTLKLSSKSPPTDKSTPTTPIENQEKTPKPIKQVIKPKSTIKSPSSTPTKSKKEEANRKVLVSSRTNSGLKRTQITKKEIKPAKPINEIETEGISSKKDSNIIYKSSLISGDKDKSGEEEDILIVEKVAITPEKLLTPDGKKIIANELDGILTTAKDIVIKEKCVEKLSDSGATTAPTMPEDEKINDSKKEIEVNESDQKSEEFKKAKDALKTPDEVADLPFHEEADEHKTKVTEKVIETEIESQEIVQVENAEYVLVSLDSSPEALKRQVLDNVNLLDTELDEESEKEDEYVEKKESKLIEHLLESSKDLCEITDKIDELKKQNEHEINNHLIHENLQNYSHGNTETINVCAELINQEKQIEIQEKAKSRGSLSDETLQTMVNETITTATNVINRSGSTTEEQERVSEHIRATHESKVSTKPDSIDNEQVQSSLNDTNTSSSKITSRSGSISIDKKANTTEKTTDKQDSKASSNAGSVCEEPVKSPVNETVTSSSKVASRSGSITDDQAKTTEISEDKKDSKASSKEASVCDEPVKSPVNETITSSSKVASRSASITNEQEKTTGNVNDNQDSKASSRAGSVCDEHVKSPVHETFTSSSKVASRSGSIITEEQEKTTDKQDSKASSKAGSVCDEPVKSPVHETILTANKVPSRSGSITTDEQEKTLDKLESKTSSKSGSVCDEPVKSPVHETILTANKVPSRSGSITTDEQEKTLDKLESKASSKSSSVCDEPVKSPIRETITSSSKVASRSGSITNEQEKTTENVNDNQDSKVSSRAGSVCDKHVKSPVYETITSSSKVASRSGSITTDEQEITTDIMDSKASSKAGSVCDELVESLLCEATASDKIKTMISSSISHEPLHDNQYSKVSRKASSICEEPLKSSELEINTDVTKLKSRPSSINQDQDIVYNSLTDKQEFNASSNETSSINYREPIKIDCFEKNTNERVISSRPNSEEELLDSVPSINKYSTLENTISDISFKEQEIVSTSLINKSNSICQDTESTPTLAMDKYDIETSSRKDSFCQDKNESITISSSSTSSICQEINTQSSKLSSRKSSIIDDLIDKPSKLQIGEKSSSLQESNIYDHSIDDNSKIFNKSGSLCDEMLNMSFNKVTENVISNKTCERIVSPTLIAENTECKIDNKEGSVGEESMKSSNNETGNKGNLISSTLNSIPQKTEEEKNQSSKSSSIFDETQKLQIENNKIILSPFEIIETNVIEKKVEESKSLGRIGSLCEEIAKFLTDDDKKMSTNNTYESSCGINESTLKNNNEVLKVETEPLLQFEKNTYALNKIEKPLQLDDEVKVSEKHDNINEKNTDHSLPAENITVSNIKSSDISTILIEENNKTGIMNVAQMVGKNINDESFTKHTAITDNESKNLKTVNPISSITSEECISKLSNVLIEDIVKSSNEKNIMNNSSLTDICVNQPLGVTLNSEDLGVTKDIVMQLKRDVHEALHQCSSDDERPYTPQSESSMSRSAMNIDEDDDDNEDNKIETDDDMAGSPMSTGPSPIQMQLDNRQVEINIDFNKAIQEHRITRGEDLTTTEANGNHVTEIKTTEHDNINQNQSTSSDTVQSWGKPLGLPPVQSINNNGFDPIREWGKPFGLPSPTQPVLELGETQNMSSKITPKKLKKIMDNKPIINVMDKDSQNRIRRSESPSKLRSRSSSRMSRINPVYLDLIYVPHHGNSKYVSADFFKRVRARNYVFSGTDPSKEVLNALIEGKQAWEDQDLEVTIIPTYDTDTLGQWVAENEELLTKLKIDLSPSASRCTIKLQDHNTSCSAYRLEF